MNFERCNKKIFFVNPFFLIKKKIGGSFWLGGSYRLFYFYGMRINGTM